MEKAKQFILWFDELMIEDVPLVGGKNASLGEMYRSLTKQGVKVPNGFAITAYAYHYLLEKAGLKQEIKNILKGLDTRNMHNLAERGEKIRSLVRNAPMPKELADAISAAYVKLSAQYKTKYVDVAVRSSATAEDLPDASFAGQQETYLNIHGQQNVIEACKMCFASLFTNRAISYREDKHFDHFSIGLSIGIQKMVRSDKASSGVMFTLDTESGFKDVVFITGIYGLGENIVQGKVNPDEYYVFKPTLKQGYKPLLYKKVGSKAIKMIYDEDGSRSTRDVAVSKIDRAKFVLSESEVLKLAAWGCVIEDHYSKKAGHWKPMDIEWAKDGMSGELYIVQARPETVQSQKKKNLYEEYVLQQKGQVLVQGMSVGSKIGKGKATIIRHPSDIAQFRKGEVLVTEMTDPDWEPIMKMASAIVTERGGRTCFDGNTQLLTNKGFMTFEEIHTHGYDNLVTLSLNPATLKVEWKPILASMKRKAKKVEVSVSISGKMHDNTLRMTHDHRMINIRDAKVVKTEVKDMLANHDMACIAQRIPELTASTDKDKKLAYLLGGIMTDGSIYRSKTHGEVQFIQKQTPEKEQFIAYMQECMTSVYHKSFVASEKKVSTGMIRENHVRGQATAFRLYSKQIAYDLDEQEQHVVTTLLYGDTKLSLHFLAGVIDGDGSFCNNRIQIYVSEPRLFEAVVVACLKNGIVPQVTKNRNIWNVQIVEQLKTILSCTQRVKGAVKERTIKTRFFAARQLFGEAAKGQDKLRRDKNLYVADTLLSKRSDASFDHLLQSDMRMQRMDSTGREEEGDVYNITVADNHTYIVFTSKLTPVIACNCHAAIISRELGIPCVVGTNDATRRIKQGAPITVSCAGGEVGYAYKGMLNFTVKKHDLAKIQTPKTKIMMNLGNPEKAFSLSFLPNEGIGLAREEFIINSFIKIHPKALIDYHKLQDHKLKEEIDRLTLGYDNKAEFFVDKLAQGIAMIAAAFYPKPVILRMSDFKSNEYANLIGGHLYEPKEDNPMIGWRGASRYYKGSYREGFALECKAVKKVREAMGLTNVEVMIPMCRSPIEGKKVLAELKINRLEKGKHGLKVIAMCEVPSNVILADEFLNLFDGFSIGSNDLTQFTLAVDRDSALVSDIYDERNKAVLTLIKHVISVCNRRKKYIGFCGQAPSDHPGYAEFLVDAGIQSISLNPDSVISVTLKIVEQEKKRK
ncbi:phosphoenolpyruvate synthase [Candidatus Woesearchaeota archaeon]|nr:phosphoenolpyruvate synthase [Candidatus Woesearchaeota archaeon]